MSIAGVILTVLGLSVFETVSSTDNVIINAEVLSGMRPKSRRWFLTWGILFAVFVPRGLLPWLIVCIAVPQWRPLEALAASFSGDHLVIEAVETSAPSPSRSRFLSSCSATAWARWWSGRSRRGTSSGSSGTAT